jgi:hypothetical protein
MGRAQDTLVTAVKETTAGPQRLSAGSPEKNSKTGKGLDRGDYA